MGSLLPLPFTIMVIMKHSKFFFSVFCKSGSAIPQWNITLFRCNVVQYIDINVGRNLLPLFFTLNLNTVIINDRTSNPSWQVWKQFM